MEGEVGMKCHTQKEVVGPAMITPVCCGDKTKKPVCFEIDGFFRHVPGSWQEEGVSYPL